MPIFHRFFSVDNFKFCEFSYYDDPRYDENRDWDFKRSEGAIMKTGHFTQVLWCLNYNILLFTFLSLHSIILPQILLILIRLFGVTLRKYRAALLSLS